MTRYVPTATAGILGHRRFGYYTAGAAAAAFTPLSLSPALWPDPSDASSVTISGSSGAYIGADGLVCPNLTANYAQGPTAGTCNPLVDIDCRAKLTATDWTPTQYRGIISNRNAGAGSDGWCFMVNTTTGTLNFTIDGVAAYDSTAATGFTDGTVGWVRFTRQQSTGDIKFYTSTDGTSWTQLGTTVAGTTAAITAPTTAMRIGSLDFTGTNYPWVGTVHRVWMYSDITGTTKVFDADFENATPFVSAFTESALGAPVYVVSSTATSATADYRYIGPEGLVGTNTSSNYAVTAAQTATDVADFELVARIQRPSWVVGDYRILYANTSSAATVNDRMTVQIVDKKLAVVWYDGTTLKSVSSSADMTVVDGGTYWVKITVAYNAGGTYAIDFYQADDQSTEPSSWTAVGTQRTGAQAAGTRPSNKPIYIGSWAGYSVRLADFTIKRIIVRNAIGGTEVFDADFTSAADYCTSFTESSASALTVTITATNTPANAAGACVSQINDKSGNARHLTQGTLANMPKYWNGQNGCNCLVFDGSNDRLTYTGSVVSQPDTYFGVVRSIVNGSSKHYVDGITSRQIITSNVSGTATYQIYAGTALNSGVSADTSWHQLTALFNGGSSKIRKDGALLGSAGAAGAAALTDITLGADNLGTTFHNYLVGEFFFTPADDSGNTSAESYLKSKWGTP